LNNVKLFASFGPSSLFDLFCTCFWNCPSQLRSWPWPRRFIFQRRKQRKLRQPFKFCFLSSICVLIIKTVKKNWLQIVIHRCIWWVF
jgi:hypothetical protein